MVASPPKMSASPPKMSASRPKMSASPPKMHAAPTKMSAKLPAAAPPSQKSMADPPAMQSSPPALAKKETAAQPAAAAAAVDTAKAAQTTDEGGSMNGKLGVGILGVGLVCCCCAIAVAFGLFLLGKKKNAKRTATDRESDLKNDFIERQPMRDSQEMEPMINREAPPDTEAQLLQPTTSFPMSQAVPATEPSGVASFPGMPTIGGCSSLLTAGSMQVPMGSFAAPSTYSNQLGMTTGLQTFPQGSVV